MRDGMAPPDPLHLEGPRLQVQLALARAACFFLTSFWLVRRTVFRSSSPSQICRVGPWTWMSTRRPARCLPQLICCQVTETIPLATTRREIQPSPVRSPWQLDVQNAGNLMSAIERGRCPLGLQILVVLRNDRPARTER